MSKFKVIETLVKSITQLPGIGPKSARKAAYFLLCNRERVLKPLIDAIKAADHNILTCRLCRNLDETNPCRLCTSQEAENILCIVRDHSDLYTIQNTGAFKGKYYVLGPSFMPSASHAKDVIEHLRQRIQDENFEEIILGLQASIEGKMLLHYLTLAIEDLGRKITHLGVGISIGSDFEYIDSETMAAAILGRKPV